MLLFPDVISTLLEVLSTLRISLPLPKVPALGVERVVAFTVLISQVALFIRSESEYKVFQQHLHFHRLLSEYPCGNTYHDIH